MEVVKNDIKIGKKGVVKKIFSLISTAVVLGASYYGGQTLLRKYHEPDFKDFTGKWNCSYAIINDHLDKFYEYDVLMDLKYEDGTCKGHIELSGKDFVNNKDLYFDEDIKSCEPFEDVYSFNHERKGFEITMENGRKLNFYWSYYSDLKDFIALSPFHDYFVDPKFINRTDLINYLKYCKKEE